MDGGRGGARSRRKARMLQFVTLVFAVFLVFLGEFVVGQSSTYVRPPKAPAKSYAVEKLLQERKSLTACTDPDQVREFRLQDVNCNRFLAGSASSTCFLACLLRGLDLHCWFLKNWRVRTDACFSGRAWTDEGDMGDLQCSASDCTIWDNIGALHEYCKWRHQTLLVHFIRIWSDPRCDSGSTQSQHHLLLQVWRFRRRV